MLFLQIDILPSNNQPRKPPMILIYKKRGQKTTKKKNKQEKEMNKWKNKEKKRKKKNKLSSWKATFVWNKTFKSTIKNEPSKKHKEKSTSLYVLLLKYRNRRPQRLYSKPHHQRGHQWSYKILGWNCTKPKLIATS